MPFLARILAFFAVAILLFPAALQAEPVFRESFEQEQIPKVVDGQAKLSADTSGVTHGRQAVELAKGASIGVSFSNEEIASSDWIRIDTHVGAERPAEVKLVVVAGGLRAPLTGVVLSGEDMLSVPVSQLRKIGRGRWGWSASSLEIQNADEGSLVVDNVRLEKAQPPPGAILLDFGPDDQVVWPGFRGAPDPQIGMTSWTTNSRILSRDDGLPDPLLGDWHGVLDWGMGTHQLNLRYQGLQDAVVWIWSRHHGARFAPAEAWRLQGPGGKVFQESLSGTRILGPEGLLRGGEGPWTPEWFARNYVRLHYASGGARVSVGQNRFEAINCQPAALALVPRKHSRKLEEFVARVEEDLATYRRQFVFGFRQVPTWAPPAGGDEPDAGLIVLDPPADHAFDPDWTGSEATPAKTLSAVVPEGGRAILPFAVVPLRAQRVLRGRLSSFRSGRGDRLPVSARNEPVKLLERVPLLDPPRLRMVPWVLRESLRDVPGKVPVHGVVEFDVAPRVPPGTYESHLDLLGTAGRERVPVSLEVVDLGSVSPAPQTISRDGEAAVALPTVRVPLGTSRMRSLNGSLREEILDAGFTSIFIWMHSASPQVQSFAQNLKNSGDLSAVRQFSGYTVFEPAGLRRTLQGANPASGQVRRSVTDAAKLASKVAREMRLERYALRVRAFSAAELAAAEHIVPIAKQMSCPTALWTSGGLLDGMPKADRTALLKSVDNLHLRWADKGHKRRIEEFRQASPEGRAYLYYNYGTRVGQGFYAAAVGADGCVIAKSVGTRGPYWGWELPKSGHVALAGPRGFASTLQMLRTRQGREDLRLAMMSRALLAAATKEGFDAADLDKALADVDALADLEPLDQYGLMHFEGVNAAGLEALRAALLKAARRVAGQVNP